MSDSPKAPTPKLDTQLLHADQKLRFNGAEVTPSISVSTTFKYPENVGELLKEEPTFFDPKIHVYSRYTQQVNTRAEHVLSQLNQGYALTYASGLSAAYSALVHLAPRRIAIRDGYHGCHQTINVYQKSKDTKVQVIDINDEFREGDICWLETPENPTGLTRDMQYYADKIHAVGGKLFIDSTFGPPPLQYPFKWGADIILHSGTKYFGGHSDLLCGVLVVKTEEEWNQLHYNRTFIGNTLGSLEAWLLLRSLRTLRLRVTRQSQTATLLAQWLHQVSKIPEGKTFDGALGGVVKRVHHASLQTATKEFDPKEQMEGGWPATFAILLHKQEAAIALPHRLQYFMAATSLGGVESLIEYRLNSDTKADPTLLRLSIGLEDIEDLKADFRQAFEALASGWKVSAKL